jgi:regulator of cell morphogenesis and NO signaling
MTPIIPAPGGCRYGGSEGEDEMIEPSTTATVGEIVATDFRTAGIFEQFGIDFCCGGRQSLADACRAATVDPDDVIRALDTLPPPTGRDEDVAAWPVERLIGHIVSTHHAYVRSTMPLIASYLAKLEADHGRRHPELSRVRARFADISRELSQHMMKEEQVLFPYVAELAARGERCGRCPSPFGTVENPIRMMEREHREAADGLRVIRALTAGYSAPDDGCTTYAVCMAEMARFENDLHRHVHLENNVLFPKAITLESASGLR